jgi:hypothetical protein
MRVCEKYRRDSAFSAAHDQCVGACERAVGQPLTLVDLMMMPNQRPSRCANHVPWDTPQPPCANHVPWDTPQPVRQPCAMRPSRCSP